MLLAWACLAVRSTAAAHRADAADDHTGCAEDDEPDALVGGCASDRFRDFGSSGVRGRDAVGEEDDTDDEDSEGDDFIHGRSVLVVFAGYGIDLTQGFAARVPPGR